MSILIKADKIWYKPDYKDKVKLPPELWMVERAEDGWCPVPYYFKLLFRDGSRSFMRFLLKNQHGLVIILKDGKYSYYRVALLVHDWNFLGYGDVLLHAYVLAGASA